MRSGQHSTPCCAFDEPGNVHLTFHNSFSLYPFWFLFSGFCFFFFSFLVRNLRLWTWWWWRRCTRPLLMMTLSSLSRPQKKQNKKSEIKYKNEKKKKNNPHFLRVYILFPLSCCPAVSLDPSMRSSYDSSAGPVDSLCVSSVRHSMGSHEKKGKILFI